MFETWNRRAVQIAAWAAIGAGAMAWSCAAGQVDDGPGVDLPDSGPTGGDGAVGTDAPGDDAPAPGDDDATGPGPGDDAAPGDDTTGDDAGGDDASGDDGSALDADLGDAGGPDAADASKHDAGHDAGADAGKDAAPPVDAGSDANVDAGCGPGTVVVNEVQTSGANGADDEWVELYNQTACPVDISGWTLRHTAATGTTISKEFTAAALTTLGIHGYGVVAGIKYSAAAATIGAFPSGLLADTGGGIGLYDASGTLIDSVGYGAGATNPFVETAPAPAGVTSKSIARVPNGTDTNDNSANFTLVSTPTPGAAN